MLLKTMYWDIKDPSTLKEWMYEIVINFPGRLGFLLRYKALKNYFKKSGKNLKIHKGCRIINVNKLEVGNNVHFGVDSYLQAGGGIIIGNFTEMGPGVKIWSQTHNYDDPNLSLERSGYKYNSVKIGNNVWIGANAFIMPGTYIGDGCIISACSYLGAKKWPNNSIIAGNPARKIGERGKIRKAK